MFFLSYTIGIFAFFCFVFAGVLCVRRYFDARAIYLALLTLCAGTWALGNATADLATSETAIMGWTMVATFGFVFFSTFFLCFVASFKRNGSLPWYLLLALCAPGSIFYALAFNPLTLERSIYNPTVVEGMPAQISFGLFYIVLALVIHFFLAAGIVALFLYARHAGATIRLQSLYIIIGSSAALIGSALFDVILPLLGENRFYNIGPLSTGIMIGCLSYAIIRHHLLDIRIIVQKSLIYTALFSIIIAAYVAVLETIGLLLEINTTLAAPISAGIVMVLGIFTVPIIERYFRRATDSFFFKDTYDYADVLERLSEALHRNVEFDAMSRQVREVLDETFHPETISIKDSGEIVLGPKRSGDIYTSRDDHLLTTFAHQTATAFERARLFGQVTRHAAELEQKIYERTRQLQDIQEKQARMMLDISHGLQTPLAVFQTRLEQLKQTIPNDKDLEQLEVSLTDVSNFIYNLLKLAYLESKQEEIILAPLCLSSLLAGIVEEIETIAATHDILVRQKVTPDVYVRGDVKKIRDVVMNLASNSIKYMRPESKKEVVFSLEVDETHAILSVSDTGVGIAKEDLPFVFERFYRVQHSPGRINGSGLGLAISKHIVKEHGGTLAVESEFGVGTTITIRLPIP